MQTATYTRRSGRIAKRIPITLRWQPPGCDVQDDDAETAVLSRYGCSVICDNTLKIGREVYLMDPQSGKCIKARVVYREFKPKNPNVCVALEFVGNENFWGIEFPPPPYFTARA